MPEERPRTSGTYDAMLKRLVSAYLAELAGWLVGKRPRLARQSDPVLPVVQSRLGDKLLDLAFEDRPPLLLHVELQTEGSPEMPRRMLQYVALLMEALRAPEHEGKELASVVVTLDPRSYRHDPGRLALEGALGPSGWTSPTRWCASGRSIPGRSSSSRLARVSGSGRWCRSWLGGRWSSCYRLRVC